MRISEVTNIEIKDQNMDDLVNDSWNETDPEQLKPATKIKDFTILRNGAIGDQTITFWATKNDDPAGFLTLIQHGKGYTTGYVRFKDEHRGTGIALEIYKWLISKGIMLISDSSQSRGGKSIWKRLFNTPGINVYGYHFNGMTKEIDFTSLEIDDFDQLAGDFDVYDNPDTSADDRRDANINKEKERAAIVQRYDHNEITHDEALDQIQKIEDAYKEESDELRKTMSSRLVAIKA